MKKINLFLACVSAFATLVGCSDLIEEPVGEPVVDSALTFTASIDALATKTTISDYKVLWEEDDLIDINGAQYKVVEGGEATASFTPVDGNAVAYGSSPLYKAYYPESIKGGALPGVQYHTAAGSLAYVNPMYAESDNTSLHFKNICGLLHLKIRGEKTVSEIVVSNESGQHLSGSYTIDERYNAVILEDGKDAVTLDCGADGVALTADGSDFYVSLPAAEYDKLGIRINTVDGCYTSFSISNATIERNACYTIGMNPQKFKEIPSGPDYFCVTNLAATNATIYLYRSKGPDVKGLEYSHDKKTWYSYTLGASLVIPGGEKLWMRGKGISAFATSAGFTQFKCNDNVKVSGDMMTLFDYEDIPAEITSPYALDKFFSSCSKLLDASDLTISATKLSDYCYRSMFSGCSNMVSAPRHLPATALGAYAYQYMFFNCVSLTSAPETLPALEIGAYCYSQMFRSCSKLVTPPAEISASSLASHSCESMFWECGKLETAPSIAATSVSNNCCAGMFQECSSLKTPPAELKALTLSRSCYSSMFDRCSSLVSAPDIKATTAAPDCCYCMFDNCTSLTSLCDLNFTTLARSCCCRMFEGCSSIIDLSDLQLPSCRLQEACFAGMFADCAGLKTIPALSSPSLAYQCYKEMFIRCTGLEDLSATSLNAENIASEAYCGMFSGCTGLKKAPLIKATGTVSNSGCSYMFKNCTSLVETQESLNASKLETDAYSTMYSGCSSLVSTPKIIAATIGSQACYGMFQYCTSLETITQLPAKSGSESYYNMFNGCTSLTTIPALPAANAYMCFDSMFSGCTGLKDLSACSLPSTLSEYGCCRRMFKDCKGLSVPPQLPAMQLYDHCYEDMFAGCTGLTDLSGYILPATGLASCCYSGMFKDCTNLVALPVIKANTLAGGCFANMFSGCTGLVDLSSYTLSAETLSSESYKKMFYGCTGLVNPPAIAAKEYGYHSCQEMFKNCTGLTSIPEFADARMGEGSCMDMFNGCTGLTDLSAYVLTPTALAMNCYDSMFSNCSNMTAAPQLPAIQLAENCYMMMFYYCKNLSSVTLSAESSATNSTLDWLYAVSPSGTIYKPAGLTLVENSESGIPSGWTAVNL